jgi:hypothetical protein
MKHSGKNSIPDVARNQYSNTGTFGAKIEHYISLSSNRNVESKI